MSSADLPVTAAGIADAVRSGTTTAREVLERSLAAVAAR
jgi:hypothetical protein